MLSDSFAADKSIFFLGISFISFFSVYCFNNLNSKLNSSNNEKQNLFFLDCEKNYEKNKNNFFYIDKPSKPILIESDEKLLEHYQYFDLDKYILIITILNSNLKSDNNNLFSILLFNENFYNFVLKYIIINENNFHNFLKEYIVSIPGSFSYKLTTYNILVSIFEDFKTLNSYNSFLSVFENQNNLNIPHKNDITFLKTFFIYICKNFLFSQD